MSVTEWLDLKVVDVRAETPAIRSLRLERPDGAPLPAWSPGAHVRVRLPDGDTRCYSLINDAADPSATRAPTFYRLGVRLEDPSNGGSSYMHALQAGDAIALSAPSNEFALEDPTGPVVLVAGGIGVTPIIGMAAHLVAAGADFRLFYCGRSRDQMAFVDDILAMAGDRVILHCDDANGLFDLVGLMQALTQDEPLYLCGPRAMIDAAIAEAARLGWAPGRLHFEIFAPAPPRDGDQPFEVELRASQKVLTIPADKTILDVMIEAGVDPLYDCKRGECGICQASVIEGVPDHRDYILTEAERDGRKLMQICVSRAKTPRLVLDL